MIKYGCTNKARSISHGKPGPGVKTQMGCGLWPTRPEGPYKKKNEGPILIKVHAGTHLEPERRVASYGLYQRFDKLLHPIGRDLLPYYKTLLEKFLRRQVVSSTSTGMRHVVSMK